MNDRYCRTPNYRMELDFRRTMINEDHRALMYLIIETFSDLFLFGGSVDVCANKKQNCFLY